MREQIDKRIGVGSAFLLASSGVRWVAQGGAAQHYLFEGAGFDGIQGRLNRVLVLLPLPFAGTRRAR